MHKQTVWKWIWRGLTVLYVILFALGIGLAAYGAYFRFFVRCTTK